VRVAVTDGGVPGVRGGIWLVCHRGVLAEVSEPPPLPVRPFENAQIADLALVAY
jgi:hypothetical protein